MFNVSLCSIEISGYVAELRINFKSASLVASVWNSGHLRPIREERTSRVAKGADILNFSVLTFFTNLNIETKVFILNEKEIRLTSCFCSLRWFVIIFRKVCKIIHPNVLKMCVEFLIHKQMTVYNPHWLKDFTDEWGVGPKRWWGCWS